MKEPVEWHISEPVNRDPWWSAHIDGLDLLLSVCCGTPWCWEWSVSVNDALPEGGLELARGAMCFFEEEEDGVAWNYQYADRVKQRCEAVARALLADGEGAG